MKLFKKIWRSLNPDRKKGNEQRQSATDYLKQCRRALKSLDFRTADSLILEGFGDFPDDDNLKHQYVRNALAHSDWINAIRRWDEFVKPTSSSIPVDLKIKIGKAYFGLDKFEQAESLLLAAVDEHPKHIQAQIALTDFYFGLANRMRRLEKAAKAESIEPMNTKRTSSTFYYNEASAVGLSLYDKAPTKHRHHIMAKHVLSKLNVMEAQTTTATHSLLQELLAPFETIVPKQAFKSLFSTLESVRDTPEKRDLLQQNMIPVLENHDPSELDIDQWLGIADMLMWHGMFQAGLLAREHSLTEAQRLGMSADANNYRVMKGFQAAVESGDPEKAAQLLNKIESNSPAKERATSAAAYWELHFGHIKTFQNLRSTNLESTDHKFKKYVENRSVAIVGPAPNGEMTGSEIDEFDIVIRFNYLGLPSKENEAEFGSKTNVSIYSDGVFRLLNAQNKSIDVPDLDYWLVRSNFYNILNQNKICPRNPRILLRNNFLFAKTAIGLPAGLFDILHFSPSYVKIFKMNFYLSSVPYFDGYAGRRDHGRRYNSSLIQSAISSHDLISQIRFIRNLWEQGMLDCDSTLESILRKSDFNYSQTLESIYFGS